MTSEAQKEDPRVEAGGAKWGPSEAEGEGAGEAMRENVGPSPDSSHYVLVTRNYDGLRIEQQVLKSELGKGEYKDLSMDSKNVKEMHPAANQPTSGLAEEEIKAEGRKRS
jgi:hypothetical protein